MTTRDASAAAEPTAPLSGAGNVGGAGSAGDVEHRTSIVCMGCAHPAKFPETIERALVGGDAAAKDIVELLRSRDPTHRHVQSALDLVDTNKKVAHGASEQQPTTSMTASAGGAGTGFTPIKWGELARFRRESGPAVWERSLRGILEGVTAKREKQRGGPQETCQESRQ
jgi:hypothetical protein